MNMEHLKYLRTVAEADVAQVEKKEATYQGSWKKRGGVGAFMMAARKWDRLENMLKNNFDILAEMLVSSSGKDGTVLAEVRDLRQYLLLFEAEIMSRQQGGKVLGLPMVETPEIVMVDEGREPYIVLGECPDSNVYEQRAKDVWRMKEVTVQKPIAPWNTYYLVTATGWFLLDRNTVKHDLPHLFSHLNDYEWQILIPAHQDLYKKNSEGVWCIRKNYEAWT